MWQATKPLRYDLPDTRRFLELLNSRPTFFDPTRPVYLGRAPGRLDLMGGIADYSGSLVLELPLALATYVAAQATSEPFFMVETVVEGDFGVQTQASFPLKWLTDFESYPQLQAQLAADAGSSWAAYLAGTLAVLVRERGLRLSEGGVRLLVASEVPTGKGVSSSAALEVASMQALCALYGLALSGRDLALLCQMAENLVVGAPCGVMDQMTSACGEPNKLLALLCQPAELQTGVALPPEVEVWGIDSGIRHAVSGADYGSVRVGAFMGYRIIAELAELEVTYPSPGRVEVQDQRWQGYLANLTPSEWETYYRDRLPEKLSGAEFLARFGGSTDSVTQIDPNRTYAVRQPTAHPIYEHHRVKLFHALLQGSSISEEKLRLLGELMYLSHTSYSACGLGSSGTDALVEMTREAGPERGLYGAKITGGGSGGTVAVLARRGQKAAVEAVAKRYAAETGRAALIIGGSSPGAIEHGPLILKWV